MNQKTKRSARGTIRPLDPQQVLRRGTFNQSSGRGRAKIQVKAKPGESSEPQLSILGVPALGQSQGGQVFMVDERGQISVIDGTTGHTRFSVGASGAVDVFDSSGGLRHNLDAAGGYTLYDGSGNALLNIDATGRIKAPELMLTGNGFRLEDEFTGSAVDAGKWNVTTSGGGAATIVDDQPAGGSGALQVTAAASQAATVATSNLPVGTKDYIWVARLRLSAAPDGNLSKAAIGIGVPGSGGFDAAVFETLSSASASKWSFGYGSSNIVTTVDYTADTTYHTVAMIRIGGQLSVYVDGAQVGATVADATNIPTSKFYAQSGGGVAAPTVTMLVDFMRVWIGR